MLQCLVHKDITYHNCLCVCFSLLLQYTGKGGKGKVLYILIVSPASRLFYGGILKVNMFYALFIFVFVHAKFTHGENEKLRILFCVCMSMVENS